MNQPLRKLTAALAALFVCASPTLAATPQEKAFTDTYRRSLEGKDAASLELLLYTKGADPMALEFYKMMMTAEMGQKISHIELRDLTPEEATKANSPMPSPSGGMSKLPLKAIKKLVLKISTSDANGSSTSSSESFVAEVEGRLVIPVPVPAN